MSGWRRIAGVLGGLLLLVACDAGKGATHGSTPAIRTSATQSTIGPGPGQPTSSPASPADGVPRFDHIVVVVVENHAYGQVIGASQAPFLNSLAARGAVLTRSYAVSHPSQPNYLALFSGSTHGLVDDSCPHTFTGPNLATALLAGGRTFAGYSESLPSAGYTGCSAGSYARKHAPWTDFAGLPRTVNQPMTSFPSNLNALPDVSFVIPNLRHDMHDGTVAQSDRWLQQRLGAYANWSSAHNSLLIVTADEDDNHSGNRIATVLAGAHVRAGRYGTRTNHYGLLRTVLASCGLTPFGGAAKTAPIVGLWAT
ncbi:MAG: alkaline phosphatase family protein [Jatrophihabitans sp.]